MKGKRLLSILLSLMVMVSMCFAGTAGVFAGTDQENGTEVLTDEEFAEVVEAGEVETADAAVDAAEEAPELEVESEGLVEAASMEASDAAASAYAVPAGSTITAENINSSSSGSVYQTPNSSTSNNYTYYTYYVSMPSAGTLVAKAYSPNGRYTYISANGYENIGSQTADDGTVIKMFRVTGAQTVAVQLELDNYKASEFLYFQFLYAPSGANTITAPVGKLSSWYYHGGTGNSSTTTQFKVKVNYPGYLLLDIQDDLSTDYTVQIKGNGFKDYEYVSSSNIRRYIGVQKGTYTFYVKSYSAIYDVRARLYKVSQSKYGTKKKKAATLKAKKAAKGLLVTNAKKVHWYKFKNKKLHKVKISVTTMINGGGGYGSLKISAYDKRGLIGTKTIYPETKSSSFYLYTIGKGNKLVKGTYYLKVESSNGGNGYFTVKWK